MAAILISRNQARHLGLIIPSYNHNNEITLLQIGASDYEFVLVCPETKQFIVGDYNKLNDNHGHLERCSVLINSLHELRNHPFKCITFETIDEYKIKFTDTEIKISMGSDLVEFHQDDNWYDMFMQSPINILDVYGVL